MIILNPHNPAAKPQIIRLGPEIARGAAGSIRIIEGHSGILAKLYFDLADSAALERKIDCMLAAPPQLDPIVHEEKTFVQVAWPSAKIFDDSRRFRGFVMPEINLLESTALENMLQPAMRRRKGLPEFYGNHVLIAANLASIVSALHELTHYMIDMKPMNVRVYPHACFMAILDADGFSIGGTLRSPATHVSDDYIAPEFRGADVATLGIEQDLFALAVIIFRLLNNGVHSYQGIPPPALNQPTTLQERIHQNLYCYSMNGPRCAEPHAASLHEYLEDNTRHLFDRAFLMSGSRPSAAEWRNHLNELVTSGVLRKCSQKPDKHAHFSKGCGICKVEKRIATIPAIAPALGVFRKSTSRGQVPSTAVFRNTPTMRGNVQSGSLFSSIPASRHARYSAHISPPPPKHRSLSAGKLFIGLMVGVFLIWLVFPWSYYFDMIKHGSKIGEIMSGIQTIREDKALAEAHKLNNIILEYDKVLKLAPGHEAARTGLATAMHSYKQLSERPSGTKVSFTVGYSVSPPFFPNPLARNPPLNWRKGSASVDDNGIHFSKVMQSWSHLRNQYRQVNNVRLNYSFIKNYTFGYCGFANDRRKVLCGSFYLNNGTRIPLYFDSLSDLGVFRKTVTDRITTWRSKHWLLSSGRYYGLQRNHLE